MPDATRPRPARAARRGRSAPSWPATGSTEGVCTGRGACAETPGCGAGGWIPETPGAGRGAMANTPGVTVFGAWLCTPG
jgi:hypothetical protein